MDVNNFRIWSSRMLKRNRARHTLTGILKHTSRPNNPDFVISSHPPPFALWFFKLKLLEGGETLPKEKTWSPLQNLTCPQVSFQTSDKQVHPTLTAAHPQNLHVTPKSIFGLVWLFSFACSLIPSKFKTQAMIFHQVENPHSNARCTPPPNLTLVSQEATQATFESDLSSLFPMFVTSRVGWSSLMVLSLRR